VLAVSRAILEYAIEGNLSKFRIEREWLSPRRRKTLTELIQELEKRLPDHKDAMNRIRESGNEYLHPRRTELSKAMLLRREATARSIIKDVVEVTEALYLALGTS
jgi:hypothetical protein